MAKKVLDLRKAPLRLRAAAQSEELRAPVPEREFTLSEAEGLKVLRKSRGK